MKRIFSATPMLGLVSLCAVLILSSCNKFKDDDSANTPVAGLMAFNLAPSKTLAVALNGNLLTNYPLSYTSFTGGYLNVYPGTRKFEAYDYSNGDSIAINSFSFEPNKYYSAFVLGANNTYRNVIVRDNFDSLDATTSNAFVRYINAIPDSASPNVTISANGNNVVNENAGYASISEFKAVTPGQVSIAVSNGTTINKSRTITLEEKRAYTVLLVGVPGVTTADSLQVKYVENGLLSGSAQRASGTAGRSAN